MGARLERGCPLRSHAPAPQCKLARGGGSPAAHPAAAWARGRRAAECGTCRACAAAAPARWAPRQACLAGRARTRPACFQRAQRMVRLLHGAAWGRSWHESPRGTGRSTAVNRPTHARSRTPMQLSMLLVLCRSWKLGIMVMRSSSAKNSSCAAGDSRGSTLCSCPSRHNAARAGLRGERVHDRGMALALTTH